MVWAVSFDDLFSQEPVSPSVTLQTLQCHIFSAQVAPADQLLLPYI